MVTKPMLGRFIKKKKREEEDKEEEKADDDKGEDILGKLAEKHTADANVAPDTSRYEEVMQLAISVRVCQGSKYQQAYKSNKI